MNLRRIWLWLVGLPLLAATLACRDEPTITTVDEPRTTAREKPLDAQEVAGSLDYMLAAIVPQSEDAWFFKLVAKGDAVDALREPFNDFVSSIQVDKDSDKPSWKLPSGWTERAGGGEMRTATIDVPHDGQKLELTVSKLPLSQEWGPYVADNVNRWLGQLQQGSLPEATIAKMTREVKLDGGEATTIELRGLMKAPMGAMPPGHPPTGASRPSTPTAEQPSATNADADVGATASKEFEFTPPSGWQPGEMNQMRKASFVVTDGDKQAIFTVTTFSAAAPAMADPVGNARRWAGEVGQSALNDAQLKAAQQQTTVSGLEAQVFEFFGERDGKPWGTIAAMLRRGEFMWFFKLTGDQQVVETQRDAFSEFLRSVKFAPQTPG